ncbi:hypothetical protein BJ085DRAFT_38859, partial [Dimargaris cristalligena]
MSFPFVRDLSNHAHRPSSNSLGLYRQVAAATTSWPSPPVHDFSNGHRSYSEPPSAADLAVPSSPATLGQPQPRWETLLQRLQHCQDFVGSTATHLKAVSLARERLQAPELRVGLVALSNTSLPNLLCALFDNPLHDSTVRDGLRNLDYSSTGKPIRFRYGPSLSATESTKYVDIALPAECLQQQTVELTVIPSLNRAAEIESDLVHRFDMFAILHNARDLHWTPSEQRLVQIILTYRPSAVLLQDHVEAFYGPSGAAPPAIPLETTQAILAALAAQGQSLMEALRPTKKSPMSSLSDYDSGVASSKMLPTGSVRALPFSSQLATQAQLTLRESPQNSPLFQRLWTLSNAAQLRSFFKDEQSLASSPAVGKMRTLNAQNTLYQAAGELRSTVSTMNQVFHSLVGKMDQLQARLNQQYSPALDRSLDEDLETIGADLTRTQQQVQETLRRLSFWTIFTHPTLVSEQLLEALQSNYLRDTELRMVYTSGRINTRLDDLVREVQADWTTHAPLFNQWLQWRQSVPTAAAEGSEADQGHLTQAAQLTQVRDQLAQWVNPPRGDIIDPFFLSHWVWRWQTQSAQLPTVELVTGQIERSSLQGGLMQVAA